MAIKNLRTLRRFEALANSDVTDVNTYNFRSLQEIQEYVRQLMLNAGEDIAEIENFKKMFQPASLIGQARLQAVATSIRSVRVIKQGAPSTSPGTPRAKIKEGDAVPVEFVAPPGKELTQKYSALNRLHAKIEALDSIIYMIAHEFHNDPKMTGQMTRDFKAKRDTLQKALNDAYKFLETVAKKSEPRQFKLLVKHLVAKVVETFGESFDGYKEYAYVSPKTVGKETYFEFNHYLEVNNFRSDDGTVYPKYYIVFTGVVDPAKKMRFYFSTLTTYAPPGRFKPEHPFTKESTAWNDLQIALEAEDFSTFIERVPLDVTTTQLKKLKLGVPSDFIVAMGIEDNVITFALNGSKVKDKQSATNVADVINKTLLIRLVPNVKGTMKRRPPYKPKGSNNWILDFVVVKPSKQHLKDVRIDQRLVDRLMQEFEWSQSKAVQFVRQFNKMVSEDFDASEAHDEPGTKTIVQQAPAQDKGASDEIIEVMTSVMEALSISFKPASKMSRFPTMIDAHGTNKAKLTTALKTAIKGTKLKLDSVRVEPEEIAVTFSTARTPTGNGRYIAKLVKNKPMQIV